MDPYDLLEQYRVNKSRELLGQISFHIPSCYSQELCVIWNTLDILDKYCVATGALKSSDFFEIHSFEICLAWATVYLDYPGNKIIQERIKDRLDSHALGISWMSEEEPEEIRECFQYYVSWF